MNHTAGPWHVGMKPGPMVYGLNGEQVADLRADVLVNNERAANARLIAAAPELLAALQETLRASPMGPHVKRAQAAIAKAAP